MKSIAIALSSTLLLGACSYNGMLGFELEITPELVNVRPVTEEVSDSPHCPQWRARKYWC